MDLFELSKIVLLINREPLGKIRFARTIYFVHKELIRKKLMRAEDIVYIRSPLGPTPQGFANLALDHPSIIIRKVKEATSSFTAEEYLFQPNKTDADSESTMLEQYRDLLAIVSRTLDALRSYSTPELVQASHNDPSWMKTPNGAEYFITPADLKNPFPFATIRIKIHLKKTTPNELGALQANLLRGMITDIVQESTDLEYPDEYRNPSHPAGNQSKIPLPFLRWLRIDLKKNQSKSKTNSPKNRTNPEHNSSTGKGN